MNWGTINDAAQAVFGVFTTSVAVVTIAFALSADRREVGVLEKLSSIVSSMPPGPARDVLAKERDTRAFTWALAPQSPKYLGLLFTATVCVFLGLLAFATWVVLVLNQLDEAWPWAFHSGALALASGGVLLGWFRRVRREDWIKARRAQLEWPGI